MGWEICRSRDGGRSVKPMPADFTRAAEVLVPGRGFRSAVCGTRCGTMPKRFPPARSKPPGFSMPAKAKMIGCEIARMPGKKFVSTVAKRLADWSEPRILRTRASPASWPGSQTVDSRRRREIRRRSPCGSAGVPLRPVPAPGDPPKTAPPRPHPPHPKNLRPADAVAARVKTDSPAGLAGSHRPRSDSRDFGSREILDGSRSGLPAFPTAVAAPEHAGLRPPHRSARRFRVAENRSPPKSAFDSPGRKARQPLAPVGRTLHRPRRAFSPASVAAGRFAAGSLFR